MECEEKMRMLQYQKEPSCYSDRHSISIFRGINSSRNAQEEKTSKLLALAALEHICDVKAYLDQKLISQSSDWGSEFMDEWEKMEMVEKRNTPSVNSSHLSS
uniref:Uncharacterized protein n=1 Tax=Plectus sambesii TaxID=2011161 RepID=A0A914XJC2_9BILA